MRDAFGRDGYVWEGLRDAAAGFPRLLAVVLITAAVLFAGWHVLPALAVKDNPPLACQLDGGHWSLWGGWSCG